MTTDPLTVTFCDNPPVIFGKRAQFAVMNNRTGEHLSHHTTRANAAATIERIAASRERAIAEEAQRQAHNDRQTRTTYRYTLATGEQIEAEHLPTARAAAYQAAHDDNTKIIDGPELIESPAPQGWTQADTSTEEEDTEPYTSPDDYPGTMKEDEDHARELDHYGGPYPTDYAQLHTYDDRAHTLKMRAGSAYQRHDGAQRRQAHRLGLTITNSATDRQLIARDRLWKGSRLP
jgi:hypothetical protein